MTAQNQTFREQVLRGPVLPRIGENLLDVADLITVRTNDGGALLQSYRDWRRDVLNVQ